MNKLFSSIIIMCASLGISTDYSLKEVQASDKIISPQVLSDLTEIRRSGKLTPQSCTKYHDFGGQIENTLAKGIPNQEYGYKIIQFIIEQAFNDKNRAKNIMNECRNILHLLYTTTSDPEHLQSSSRFVILHVLLSQDLYDRNCNSTDKLPSEDKMSIEINKSWEPYKTRSNEYYLSDLTYSFEKIRQSAFKGDSEIFNEIFEASRIWYNNGQHSSNRCKTQKVYEHEIATFQILAEDLCRLVGLSLMIGYADNSDSELVLSASEG